MEYSRMGMKERSSGGVGGVGGGGWVRACDSCRSAACAVYCRADSAFLCVGCDARVHGGGGNNRVRHDRVWVCEACENAPAAVTCKADAAALCAGCDADIHAANPLARRHQRRPILPIPHHHMNHPSTPMAIDININAAADIDRPGFGSHDVDDEEEDDDDNDDEAASWLLPNGAACPPPAPPKNGTSCTNNAGVVLYEGTHGEVDEYLDLVEYNDGEYNDQQHTMNYGHDHQYTSTTTTTTSTTVNRKLQQLQGSDSVVPVQCVGSGNDQNQNAHNFQLDLEFDHSCSKPTYGYPASVNHSSTVSLSSMEAGIVPDQTMVSDIISNSNSTRPTKGTIDLFTGPPLQMTAAAAAQFCPMDREARVLRYREKRKTRKFEKTIRYASRKAYAETRPRIKGRFAKRSDINAEVEVDQMFSSAAVMVDTAGYGVVPSF